MKEPHSSPELQRTPLHATHVACGGKMVDFAGWHMPLHYGSQISEHNAVRRYAGMFDVSHMTVMDVDGPAAHPLLDRLVANDVGRLRETGRALYGLMLNEAGGVLDDLIVYRREQGYRVVANCATRVKILDWITAHNDQGAEIAERDVAMIAVQGPEALGRFSAATGWNDLPSLAAFSAVERDGWMVARTGYTGEDGVEVMLPGREAAALWQRLQELEVQPAGLAARDTLRLEAGLNLYGQDMDESTNPLISNLAWTIAWQPETRNFTGRRALETARAAGIREKLTGLVLEHRGVLRRDQRVVTADGSGVITSGIFSPTLGYSIALARLPRSATGECQVEVRGKLLPVRIVRPPFVRGGRRVFE